MDRLRDYQSSIFASSDCKVLEVPDDVGELKSSICSYAFDKLYVFGCVDVDALVLQLESSLSIIDTKRATVFYVLQSGAVFCLGVEDCRWEAFNDEIAFFSDSGIYLLTEKGVRNLDFMLLNEYHISIDFSEIAKKIIRFELGDSRILRRSIDDLDELIGRDIVQASPRASCLERGMLVYDLTGKP